MERKNNYIDAQDMCNEIKKYQDQHNVDENAKPNDKIGQMLITMTQHILGHSNFRNYNYSLKDEMQSYALMKCIKGLCKAKCGNCTKEDAKLVFNYFTRAIFNSYLTVIGKYYKQINIKRELAKQYIHQLEVTAPAQATNLKKSIIEIDV